MGGDAAAVVGEVVVAAVVGGIVVAGVAGDRHLQ